MLNFNKIKFVCEEAKAASFTLTQEGLKISVSLNIKSPMVKYLQPQVRKSHKFYVHTVSATVKEINSISVYNTYKQLLGRAMINCRRAKQLVIKEEIRDLEYKQLTFKF